MSGNSEKRPISWGSSNVTPDSFSDGGNFIDVGIAVKHALQMKEDGADIIDVGGESTRPGSEEVSEDEEIRRVIPLIENLYNIIHLPISIDTYKASVAEMAIKAGASIINDVWGFQRDPKIAKVAAKHHTMCILMHNQNGTHYDEDIMIAMRRFFKKSIEIAVNAGVDPTKIILDPGIGFGKTAEQNIEVISRLEELKELGCPILLGTSRKSFLGKILDLEPHERLEGTIASNVIGVSKGVDIIRVHDVKENYRAMKVADTIIRKN